MDYITTAFCILRRHANLIINLFSLMLDAGIPDIAVEKEKTVQKVYRAFNFFSYCERGGECPRQEF